MPESGRGGDEVGIPARNAEAISGAGSSDIASPHAIRQICDAASDFAPLGAVSPWQSASCVAAIAVLGIAAAG